MDLVNTVRDWLGFILVPLEKPFRWFLEEVFETSGSMPMYLVYDLVALFAVYVILRTLYNKIRDLFRKNTLADSADIDALVTKKNEFATSLKASKHLESTIEPIKKAKQWDKLAAIYAEVGRPKEAAKYFKKVGDLKRAAEQLARAGQTVKAAQTNDEVGRFCNRRPVFP